MNYDLIDRSGEERGLVDSLISSVHQCPNPLALSFFSASNMNTIQSNLRIIVREKTGYVIGRQSEEQMSIIMRGIYSLYADHGNNVDAEVRRLNAIVLSHVAPQVGTGIASYLGYIRDSTQMHVPLERPKNMSIKGSTTTELFKGL